MIASNKQSTEKNWKDSSMKIKANALEISKGPHMIRIIANTTKKDAVVVIDMQKLDSSMLYKFLFWGSWPNLS